MNMKCETLTIGAAKLTPVEESYGYFCEALNFFADWRGEITAEPTRWMATDHFDPATGYIKLSIQLWLVEVGGWKTLMNTCISNHKSHKHRPFWDNLDTPYIARLARSGTRPPRPRNAGFRRCAGSS